MIKLSILIKRAPGLAREAFHAHWRERHAALYLGSDAALRYVRRYVLCHTTDEDYERGAAYDGIAELWFDTDEDVGRFLADPDYLSRIRPDELCFADPESLVMLRTAETVILPAPPSPVEVLRQWYETVDLSLLDEGIVWEMANNFLGGGTVRGRDAVFSDVFGRIRSAFGPWRAVVADLYGGDGETVIATGRYEGTAKSTGNLVSAPFAHVWKVRGGKITFAQQYTDTFHLAKVQGLF